MRVTVNAMLTSVHRTFELRWDQRNRFRGRIIIPIRDASARAIGLGGRIMPGVEGPKYLNSPETPIFHKGKSLYNLDAAKNAIRKEETAIVVEGYFDVIRLVTGSGDLGIAAYYMIVAGVISGISSDIRELELGGAKLNRGKDSADQLTVVKQALMLPDRLRDGPVGDLFEDQMAAQLPFSALVVAALEDALEITAPRPVAVVIRASPMSPASNSGRPMPPPAMVWKAPIMPLTVPRSPIMGATVATTFK